MKFRKESDTMGEVSIPADLLYGASTGRAVENFPVSGKPIPSALIRALGLIKWSGALANKELKKLDLKQADAIAAAALEVADGKHDKHFPIDIFQTGSGTSSNMNANEVIANLAGRKSIHPNDHVNMGQSSNDVFPTAIHVAAATMIQKNLLPNLNLLQSAFAAKAKEFKDVIKIGRTHLQDATPITLGQEFSGYAAQIKKSSQRISQALEGLQELAIGGTAVGTGINTHPRFAKLVCQYLKQKTGVAFHEAENHFEAQAAKDACLFASGALKTLAASLFKIANDLRWLASGPRCGFYEIELPALQPGSSIMPGKVNPVIPEAITQIAAQVIGNDAAITIGAASGNFELNVYMPMIAANLLESIEILSNGSKILAKKCVQNIQADKERCAELVEESLAMVTSLVPVIGYDKATQIAKEAYKKRLTIRQLLLEKEILSKKELDKILDPRSMLAPR
ncbi:MAG: class II fumarate hydratase [Deltaproteobacteria bacterium]|nr:class II fumarate hydratase [Deltaproteobacteria bacterium]